MAIDFDSISDRIFWSDTTQDKIWSAYQNGTDRKVVSFTEFHLCLHFLSTVKRLSPLKGRGKCPYIKRDRLSETTQ